MAKAMKFRFNRQPDSSGHTHDPEAVGFEATVNVAGWPAPQVLSVGLEDASFGDFRGDPGAAGTLELRYVDEDGSKSVTPSTQSFTLPTNFAPVTPSDVFEIETTGEEHNTPPVEPVEPPPVE